MGVEKATQGLIGLFGAAIFLILGIIPFSIGVATGRKPDNSEAHIFDIYRWALLLGGTSHDVISSLAQWEGVEIYGETTNVEDIKALEEIEEFPVNIPEAFPAEPQATPPEDPQFNEQSFYTRDQLGVEE